MKITKSKTAKIVAGLLGAAMSLSFVFSSVAGAQALSPAELSLLQSLLARYQATAGTTTTTSTMSTPAYTFNSDLTIGSTGADVLALQKFLNASGFTVSTSGAGSPGNESSYFGAKTQAAVSAYQVAKGISPTAGYFGPKTRGVVNAAEAAMSTTGSTTTTTTTGGSTTTTTSGVAGSLVVSSAVQPANSLAPQGAARVPFTRFTITAGATSVVVNSVTVQRSSLAQDAVFAGVVLLDPNGIQIGIAKTLNSNHQADIGDIGFTVPAGTSETFTVAGNMASNLTNYAGQVAELDVVAINTSATVSGALPILGSQQTVNASLTLGTATTIISSFDPGTASTKQIGTTGYRFSGIRITAGSAEQVNLMSVRWNQTGSVSSSDLANLATYVNGVAYPATVDSTGKYYTSTFGSGIVIDKGFSADIYIQGDIVGSDAAGRTVEFDIYKTTDIYLSGVTYGYGITPTGTGPGFNGGTPFFTGHLVTVTAGSATTISNAPAVPAQNVAINVPNQPLGGFTTSIVGEPISVQSTTFTIQTSAAESAPITNVSIVDQNGSVVAGPVDATATTSSAYTTQTLNFTDTLTLPVGSDTFTLKGTIPPGYANGTIVTVTANPAGWSNVTGQVTGNTISLTANTSFALNQMTVKAASLNVGVSTTPTAQTIVAGGQQVVFANVQLDASQSGEDVRTSSIPLNLITGAVSYQNDLSACQLWNGATALNTGSNVVNPASNASLTTDPLVFTLDQSLTIPKGTVLTVAVACNLSSNAGAGHTYAFSYSSGTPITATGVTSGQTVAVTGSGTGATQTAGTGSLVVTADASTPSYTVAAAGTQGVTLGVINLQSNSQATNLQQISLVLSSGSSNDLSSVSIVDPSTNTVVGTATFTGTSKYATSTLSTLVTLPANTQKLLVIKGNLADIGTSQPGVEGDLIQVNVNGADTFGTKGTGASSGTQVYATGSTSFVGVRMFNTFPTFAAQTLNSTGIADGNLLHFSVSANSTANVGVALFKFTIATTTGVTVSNVNLFAYSDSGYSQGVTPVGGSITGQMDNQNVVANGTGFTVPMTTSGNAQSYLEIPAGQTYYFALKGSVAGVVSGSSVTTILLGDTSFSGINTEPSVATSTNISANFVWSANATTTSGLNNLDWSNGAGLPGYPSSGIIQTRSQ